MAIKRDRWWVIYDNIGRVIAMVPRDDGTPPKTFHSQPVVKSVRLSDLPKCDQDELIEIFCSDKPGPRSSTTGKRQRSGGHGYSGGDGFVDL